MEQKIYSVSEAFSMQPSSFYIGMNGMNTPEGKVTEIKKELLVENSNGENTERWVYVGYNEAGKRLYEWVAEACNVSYF